MDMKGVLDSVLLNVVCFLSPGFLYRCSTCFLFPFRGKRKQHFIWCLSLEKDELRRTSLEAFLLPGSLRPSPKSEANQINAIASDRRKV